MQLNVRDRGAYGHCPDPDGRGRKGLAGHDGYLALPASRAGLICLCEADEYAGLGETVVCGAVRAAPPHPPCPCPDPPSPQARTLSSHQSGSATVVDVPSG